MDGQEDSSKEGTIENVGLILASDKTQAVLITENDKMQVEPITKIIYLPVLKELTEWVSWRVRQKSEAKR